MLVLGYKEYYINRNDTCGYTETDTYTDTDTCTSRILIGQACKLLCAPQYQNMAFPIEWHLFRLNSNWLKVDPFAQINTYPE